VISRCDREHPNEVKPDAQHQRRKGETGPDGEEGTEVNQKKK
jgi:hypothetical protein